MAEEHGMGPEVGSEDGGVPLPDLDPEEVGLYYDASSSGSSTSIMSLVSAPGVQPSSNSSDTTSPSIPYTDQQASMELSQPSPVLPGASQGASATLVSLATTSLQVQSSILEESVASQTYEVLDGNVSQEDMLMTSHSPGVLYAAESASLLFQDADGSDPDVMVTVPTAVSDDQGLNHDLLAYSLMSSDQEAHSSNAFQVFPPPYKNHDCEKFLQIWKQLWLQRKSYFPSISDEQRGNGEEGGPDMPHRPEKVSANIMAKTLCNIQGIRWLQWQTSESLAREVRRMTSRNFINMHEINFERPPEAYATPAYKACFKSESSPALSTTDSFFHFRESNLRQLPGYCHQQLRHCLCASSKNAVFFYNKFTSDYIADPITHEVSYSGLNSPKIKCLNPEANSVRDVIDLYNLHELEIPRLLEIGCMTASNGLLIVGALHVGHYAMKSLSSTCDDAHIRSVVNKSRSGAGINHVHTFLQRCSGLPHAVFCDNDGYIRVTDCNTTKQVYGRRWESPVNCSATSPDGRLRIHVSDDRWPVVSDAETGDMIAQLSGHKDHGFACDWSPDGITMATGHQDGLVQVWDARKMSKAVHVLPAEMGGIRSLHFSPLGAGHPVLVMAEPIDFVSIVDARTFQSKQDIEFFGEISGVSMPPDGSTLFIGNADPTYGGIFEFERTGYTGQFKHRGLRCPNIRQRKSQRRQAIYKTSPEDSDCEGLVDEVSPDAKLKRRWKLDDQDAQIWRTREHDWAEEVDVDNDRRTVLMRKQRWHRHLELERIVF